MKSLNHPLKRLAFALFVCNCFALVALAVFPVPVTIETHEDWRDITGVESADRQVTRIDTACAAQTVGGLEPFARDFQIIDAHASDNKYASIITEEIIERGERFNIAPVVDLTDKELASFHALLSSTKKPCLKGMCIERLNTSLFSSILASCAKQVGQHRHVVRETKWHIAKNLEDTAPWALIALMGTVLFLFLSLLYECTIGLLVKWIRTGSW